MRDASLVEFVLDQLSALEGVDAKRMFGGYGLYLDGEFFGMVWKGRAWFRTDDRTRVEYRALGSDPIPIGDDKGRGSKLPRYEGNVYWSVPVDVLEDAPLLADWARAAAAAPRPAAQRKARWAAARKAKPKRRPSSGRRA
jgi:DNA transformation protein